MATKQKSSNMRHMSGSHGSNPGVRNSKTTGGGKPDKGVNRRTGSASKRT
jgi:hypothetical protein